MEEKEVLISIKRMSQATGVEADKIETLLKDEEKKVSYIYTYILEQLNNIIQYAKNNKLDEYFEHQGYNISGFEAVWLTLKDIVDDIYFIVVQLVKEVKMQNHLLEIKKEIEKTQTRLMKEYSHMIKIRNYYHSLKGQKNITQAIIYLGKHVDKELFEELKKEGLTNSKNFKDIAEYAHAYSEKYQQKLKKINEEVADMAKKIVKYYKKKITPKIKKWREEVEVTVENLEKIA